MRKILIRVSKVILAPMAHWLAVEILVRLYLQMPLRTNFYSSIKWKNAAVSQREIGIRVVQGPGWAHLGWNAYPEKDIWFIITVGWLWEVALTSGELAIPQWEWNPTPKSIPNG